MAGKSEVLGTLKGRLRYWRRSEVGVTQRQLCERLNRELPEDEWIPVTTVSNYERGTEPPASFLAALKQAFPDLNLDWLLLGEGEPLETQQIARLAQEELAEKEPETGGLGALAVLFEASVPPYIRRLPLSTRQHFLTTAANVSGAWPPLEQVKEGKLFGQLDELGRLLLKSFELLPFDPPAFEADSPPIRNPSFERYVEAMLLAVNLATAVEPEFGKWEEA